jgi:hypothetical protein
MQLTLIQQRASASDLRTLCSAFFAGFVPSVSAFAAIEIGTAIESFAAISPGSLIQAAIRI